MDKKKEKLIGAAGWWFCGVGLIVVSLITILKGEAFYEDLGMFYNWGLLVAGVGMIVVGFVYMRSDDFREKMDGEAERMYQVSPWNAIGSFFRIFRR